MLEQKRDASLRRRRRGARGPAIMLWSEYPSQVKTEAPAWPEVHVRSAVGGEPVASSLGSRCCTALVPTDAFDVFRKSTVVDAWDAGDA
jgi:hypothetical protein